jgi:hypothetical protein
MLDNVSAADLRNLISTQKDNLPVIAEEAREYDVLHLDYDYIKTCTDSSELEVLLRALKSGKEGIWEQLEEAIETRLSALNPNYFRYVSFAGVDT